MSTTLAVENLVAGERMTRDEFIRRWEALPNLKRAELIGGVVYMPSPLSHKHSGKSFLMAGWLATYSAKVPFCEGGCEATWFMLDDSPQPDVFLRLKDHPGGMSGLHGHYIQGAPELAVEVCLSSETYDMTVKKALYEKAGVKEYVAVLSMSMDIRWMILENGQYRAMQPDADGILRSTVFPGLWLDPVAALLGDTARVLDVLALGMKTPEFTAFAARKLPE